MRKKSKIISIIIATGAIIAVVITGFIFIGLDPGAQKTTVKIFHAGSLTVPLEELEAKFEGDYPNFDIQLEPAGSVQCVSKITQAGELADVLAVADWSLIPDISSTYQDYYIKFATNEMVLCYTESSNYKDEINATNFWSYLSKSDAIWGFSDPNLDPCGYRSLMVLQLAEFEYGNATILEELVLQHSDITVVDNGINYNISTPENLNIDSACNIKVREKSVDLVTLLKEGTLDYAFEYLSVATQHDLQWIVLEDAVNLKNANLDDTYQRVKVLKSNGKTSTGKSITYGVTVPKNALYPDIGAKFIEYLINGTGQTIFSNLGQPPIIPCPTNNLTGIPTNLQPLCVQE